MCVCVSWRIKLRIIETHDRIPYKLLDKGLGIFFLFIPTPTPLSLLFPLKQASSFDPTLHHERHLCQRLCLSPTPRSILFFSLLSFKTSSPHCLIAGSVLLCFSQHEKKTKKTTLTVGKKCIQLKQRELEREEMVSVCFVILSPTQ